MYYVGGGNEGTEWPNFTFAPIKTNVVYWCSHIPVPPFESARTLAPTYHSASYGLFQDTLPWKIVRVFEFRDDLWKNVFRSSYPLCQKGGKQT